ncbi:hypothetical protein EVAR_78791_1 [Eumeta japonica]|uniref:Uncharacterized protein n=1 Tax=Eumeta variegata TaxID=151549 RepID=A0A4C1T2D9_EUMVA|nr:hypothetical protein EVAR_78791_1 [Eumeta japonica]
MSSRMLCTIVDCRQDAVLNRCRCSTGAVQQDYYSNSRSNATCSRILILFSTLLGFVLQRATNFRWLEFRPIKSERPESHNLSSIGSHTVGTVCSRILHTPMVMAPFRWSKLESWRSREVVSGYTDIILDRHGRF